MLAFRERGPEMCELYVKVETKSGSAAGVVISGRGERRGGKKVSTNEKQKKGYFFQK